MVVARANEDVTLNAGKKFPASPDDWQQILSLENAKKMNVGRSYW